MKCPKCGANIHDTAKFCTNCGVNISEILTKNQTEPIEEKLQENQENQEKIKEKTDKLNENTKFIKKTEKNGKKKKKKHTGLKIIFVLILIILLLIAGSYGLYKLEVLPESISSVFENVEKWFEKEDSTESETAEDEEKDVKSNTVTENKKEITKIDKDEDLVYDVIDKKISGNTYKVPTINIDSIYVENCNLQIKKYVEEELKLYEKATKLPADVITSCDYYWALNDNILSVVFFIAKSDIDEYHVFNVDVYTGDAIINSEILEAAKIEDYSLAEKGSEAITDFFDNYAFDSSLDKYKTLSEYKEAYETSKGRGNFDRYMDMFLNKYGELCVIAKISIPGKSKSDNIILNIENKKRNSKQLFEGTNFPMKELVIETEIDTDTKTETEAKTKTDITNNKVI